jgi:DNA-binding MarR family transcriptional regulator
MNRPADDGADVISSMIELEADMMWRYLVDRDALSASATLVLNRLNREGPMRLTALAAAEGASQSGMTQLVQRMERQGLLERWSDPEDGRVSMVTVGDAGRRIWSTRAEVRRQRVAGLLQTVSDDDRVALWLAAQVVVRVLGRMRDTASARERAGLDIARGEPSS